MAAARTARPARRKRPRSRHAIVRIGAGFARALVAVVPSARTRRRLRKRFMRAPLGAQIAVVVATLGISWLAVNWIYHVVKKPTELFFPVSGALYKTPDETWREYAPIFRSHSTRTISPELLAALAQVEGSGNPLVRTYWRWRFTSDPLDVYRPASSAVGMYQITDGTFAEARRLCIHDHAVVEDGPWNDWRSCWFNGLYARVVPSNAVEMTSAYLDRHVAIALARRRIERATIADQQNLAAVIHLCGAQEGELFAVRGFRPLDGQHCGDHDVADYIARVRAMKAVFARLATEGQH